MAPDQRGKTSRMAGGETAAPNGQVRAVTAMLPEPAPEPTLRPASPLLTPLLTPLLELKRRRLARDNSFCLTTTPSPGSPATSARPSDVDTDSMEWWAPHLLQKTSPLLRAVEELKQYITEWWAASKDDFWHRKSLKPVLSVVVARSQSGDGPFLIYRGMNTEVSLPAGSLCAERAAIARMASDLMPSTSVMAIATADPLDKINPLWPCEVCQSWLSKLRAQSPEIAVVAVSSVSCTNFAVKINGELQPPPLQLPASVSVTRCLRPWTECIVLAEGVTKWPWECQGVVYVDGAWTFLHGGQQHILKAAKARGEHLLVGVHSDELLRELFEFPIFEDFDTRISRVLQNRHVSSVLKSATWAPTEEMIVQLGIRRVVIGSLTKMRDVGGHVALEDPYAVPRRMGILEVIQSCDDTTERSFHEAQVARMLMEEC